MNIKAIETRYAGCRFRSRLEARWALFFNIAGISWEYELEGFTIGGRSYLPDFLLPDCGTWVEVKGIETALDKGFLIEAAMQLPEMHNGMGEHGPQLVVLGPIPEPPDRGDLGWLGISEMDGKPDFGRYGFGTYYKNRRPWWLDNGGGHWHEWLTPTVDPYECSVSEEYKAARSARFEHGENG